MTKMFLHPDDLPAIRLDAFLAQALGLGLRHCRALVADGLVLVDGRPLPKGAMVRPGQRVTVSLLADANVDVWLKGNIDRSLPDNQQQLKPEVRAWADALAAKGVIENRFSTSFFVNPDSRSSLASAGLGGALIGNAIEKNQMPAKAMAIENSAGEV